MIFVEVSFKSQQRIKAFFKDGKPCVVLKLNLLLAKGKNELFNSRFNAFYEEISEACIKECERLSNEIDKPQRPISFIVDAEQNSTPVDSFSVTRIHKLRLPTGEVKRLEALDIFDAETGLLKKAKREKKRKKS